MFIDFGMAERYGGECILRYDDTNPEAEKQEYIDHIQDIISWLGWKPSKVGFNSRSPFRGFNVFFFFFDLLTTAGWPSICPDGRTGGHSRKCPHAHELHGYRGICTLILPQRSSHICTNTHTISTLACVQTQSHIHLANHLNARTCHTRMQEVIMLSLSRLMGTHVPVAVTTSGVGLLFGALMCSCNPVVHVVRGGPLAFSY